MGVAFVFFSRPHVVSMERDRGTSHNIQIHSLALHTQIFQPALAFVCP